MVLLRQPLQPMAGWMTLTKEAKTVERMRGGRGITAMVLRRRLRVAHCSHVCIVFSSSKKLGRAGTARPLKCLDRLRPRRGSQESKG